MYVSTEQYTYLKSLDRTVSEHIRTAIKDYIENLESNKVSYSPSKYGKSNNKK